MQTFFWNKISLQKIKWIIFFVIMSMVVLSHFLWMDSVLAQESGWFDFPEFEETMFSIVNILQWILKLIYIILRPILVIAWNALDNTFVYGEFLNLDAPLRQMWNVSKNFANFALWLWILYKIFAYIFWFWKDDADMKGSIVKVLVAWIAIQASRFLLWVAIDLR